MTNDSHGTAANAVPGTLVQDAGTSSAITPSGDTIQGTYHVAVNRNNAQGEDCTMAASGIG